MEKYPDFCPFWNLQEVLKEKIEVNATSRMILLIFFFFYSVNLCWTQLFSASYNIASTNETAAVLDISTRAMAEAF